MTHLQVFVKRGVFLCTVYTHSVRRFKEENKLEQTHLLFRFFLISHRRETDSFTFREKNVSLEEVTAKCVLSICNTAFSRESNLHSAPLVWLAGFMGDKTFQGLCQQAFLQNAFECCSQGHMVAL